MATNEEIRQGLEGCETAADKLLEHLVTLKKAQTTSIEHATVGMQHIREAVASFRSALGSDKRATEIGQTIASLFVEIEDRIATTGLQDSTNDNAVVIMGGIADAQTAINRGINSSEGHKVMMISAIQMYESRIEPTEISNAQLNLAASSSDDWQATVANVQAACHAYRDNL